MSAVLVSLGCLGELVWIFRKGPPKESFIIREAFEEKKHSREKLFAILIAVGVTAEVITLLHSLRESGEFRVEFGKLQQTNAWIWQTNWFLQMDVETLRSNNVVLQNKLQPRIITPIQVTNFIRLTENITKIPVKICTSTMNGDFSFAVHVRDMFTRAGFGVAPGANASFGLHVRTEATIRPPGESYEWPHILMVMYGTNDLPKQDPIKTIITYRSADNIIRPITVNTNDHTEICYDILDALQKTGLSVVIWRSTQKVALGEFEIEIPPRRN